MQLPCFVILGDKYSSTGYIASLCLRTGVIIFPSGSMKYINLKLENGQLLIENDSFFNSIRSNYFLLQELDEKIKTNNVKKIKI